MIIYMWSGPRNLSTALMRSFENRDDTEVLDEPFYSFYLKNTGLKHPMHNKIINAYPNDLKQILNKITKLPKNNKVFYQKHMTHHLIDENNLDWLKNGKNCFLIRHPAKVINSYIKKNEILEIRDIGFKKQFEIFEIVKSKYDFNPVVINSDNILKNPKEIIMKLCERLNIKFSNKMLNWPKGPRNSDGIWSVIWYEQVNKSSTFSKYSDSNTVVPSKYQKIYKESLKIYNNMNKYSL